MGWGSPDGLPQEYDFSLLGFCHHALYIQTCHLRNTVRTNSDSLLKMAWELSFPIIGNSDGSFFTRLYGALGVLRNGAPTTRNRLINNQRLVTSVGEGEGSLLHGIVLRERSEIVYQLIE